MSGGNMRIAAISAMMIIAIPFQAIWGQSDSTQSEKKGVIHSGAKYVRFKLNDLFYGGVNVLNITASYFFNNHLNIRFEYQPWISQHINDGEYYQEYIDRTLHYRNKQYRYIHQLDLALYYINYHRMPRNPLFYYGMGPHFSIHYDYDRTESSSDGNQPNFNGQIRKYEALGLGISAPFGIEWFPRKWLGIFAEYRGIILYDFTEHHESNWYNQYISNRKEDGHTVSIDIQNISVGFAAYF
jgi:hypothetical protein